MESTNIEPTTESTTELKELSKTAQPGDVKQTITISFKLAKALKALASRPGMTYEFLIQALYDEHVNRREIMETDGSKKTQNEGDENGGNNNTTKE